MDRIMSWITKSGDVRVAEDKKWLNSLRSAVIGPHPSPPRSGKGGRSDIRSPHLDAPSLAAAGEGWGGGR